MYCIPYSLEARWLYSWNFISKSFKALSVCVYVTLCTCVLTVASGIIHVELLHLSILACLYVVGLIIEEFKMVKLELRSFKLQHYPVDVLVFPFLINPYGVCRSTGLTKLESLNIKWCNCITDTDMKHLSGNMRLFHRQTHSPEKRKKEKHFKRTQKKR